MQPGERGKKEDGSFKETDRNTEMWAWKRMTPGYAEPQYIEVKGDVRLQDVDFGYTPEKQVLHDVSLFAKPGQKIAFVGATGAGKTTITNLINRFYDIADGKIRYDGININHICKPDLRRSLGIVLQDVNLFTGTVMDNIRYGRLDATDEECMEAARLANADDFITRLPEGYNTMLTGNGAQLSQGQRQLISIARAAVADPPVMILDEATSSIDTRTEALVQKGMDNLMKGRTVFVIAHRLSTVRNSDASWCWIRPDYRAGDHDELIAQKAPTTSCTPVPLSWNSYNKENNLHRPPSRGPMQVVSYLGAARPAFSRSGAGGDLVHESPQSLVSSFPLHQVSGHADSAPGPDRAPGSFCGYAFHQFTKKV